MILYGLSVIVCERVHVYIFAIEMHDLKLCVPRVRRAQNLHIHHPHFRLILLRLRSRRRRALRRRRI